MLHKLPWVEGLDERQLLIREQRLQVVNAARSQLMNNVWRRLSPFERIYCFTSDGPPASQMYEWVKNERTR